MRLRAGLRRFIDRITCLFTRLVTRVSAPGSGNVRARPVGRVAPRYTAVRPGPSFHPGRPGPSSPAPLADDADLHFISRPTPGPASVPASLPFGDFADRGEAERFAVLPPIGAGAADEVDWDALARTL